MFGVKYKGHYRKDQGPRFSPNGLVNERFIATKKLQENCAGSLEHAWFNICDIGPAIEQYELNVQLLVLPLEERDQYQTILTDQAWLINNLFITQSIDMASNPKR